MPYWSGFLRYGTEHFGEHWFPIRYKISNHFPSQGEYRSNNENISFKDFLIKFISKKPCNIALDLFRTWPFCLVSYTNALHNMLAYL